MQLKHKNCRWKSEKIKSRNFYILIEGYYWLLDVYFNNKMKLIDADIKFFKERINQYENLLNIEPKSIFEKDLKLTELPSYFNKKFETIEKAIWKMIKVHKEYRYIVNNEFIITKDGIKWLCQNCFKKKYLGLLENYKMELTDKYVKAGYIYDNFFNKN